MMLYKNKVLPILAQYRDALMQNWGTAEIVKQKSESAVDVVTKLDYEIEEKVKIDLHSIFPSIVFVGEENGGDRAAPQFWLMDPIDGTNHYVRGLPFCTSMLALIQEGEVVFSVIYDFINNEFYWAQKQCGAYRNQTRLQVSRRNLKTHILALRLI